MSEGMTQAAGMPPAAEQRMAAAPSKLRTLDALRGVAALLVVMFHTQVIFGGRLGREVFGNMFSNGLHGVDLFFVLSGFVITYAHLPDLGQPHRLRRYMFARAARIYPAVWICSALALLVYAAGYRGQGVDPSSKFQPWNLAASFLLLPQRDVPLVNVTWTLQYEMFFYVLFALLIIDLRFLVLIMLWQIAIPVAAVAGFAPSSVWAQLCLDPRCCEFGLGMASAWLFAVARRRREGRPAQGRMVPVLGLCGGLAVLAAPSIPGAARTALAAAPPTLIYGFGSLLAVAGCAFLELRRPLLLPRLVDQIGRASYAIYLVHFSVVNLAAVLLIRHRLLPLNDAACFLVAVIAVACGLAFDRFVDQPCQRMLRRARGHLLGGGQPRDHRIGVLAPDPAKAWADP